MRKASILVWTTISTLAKKQAVAVAPLQVEVADAINQRAEKTKPQG